MWYCEKVGEEIPNLKALNRRLTRELHNGNRDALDKLYRCNLNFITALAVNKSNKFHCTFLQEDLIQTGVETFIKAVSRYNPSHKAELTTWLFPHLIGDMRRAIEKQIGPTAYSKRDFEDIRKAKALNQTVMEAEELSTTMGISVEKTKELLNSSVYGESLDDDDFFTAHIEPIKDSGLPVAQQVFRKICIEHIREIFEQELDYDEQLLLGGFFGVFGYKKETLSLLGDYLYLTPAAARKRKDSALEKLSTSCWNGAFGNWVHVYRLTNKTILK